MPLAFRRAIASSGGMGTAMSISTTGTPSSALRTAPPTKRPSPRAVMTATVSGAVIQPCCLGSMRMAAPILFTVAQNGRIVRLAFARKAIGPFGAAGAAHKSALAKSSHDCHRLQCSHPAVLLGINAHGGADSFYCRAKWPDSPIGVCQKGDRAIWRDGGRPQIGPRQEQS